MNYHNGNLLGFFLAASLLSLASGQNIAVIGGGISGTFTAKYLVDYDKDCHLDALTVFDPKPIGEPTNLSEDGQDVEWQGNRIASIQLEDGRVVEIGASVFHEANQLVQEMIRNDPTLEIGRPFNIGKNGKEISARQGLGIYSGDGEWKFMSNSSQALNTFWTVVRYNIDLYLVDRATQHAIEKFKGIVPLLESDQEDTFFQSPDEMWKRVRLIGAVHNSFDATLDALGDSRGDSWLQKILPYQGSLRKELLTAINLINYNQGVSQVNGLVGLVSFAASKGPLYSVVGGNQQIVKSAFQQAQTNHQKNCRKEGVVTNVPRKVTSVVGSYDGFVLYSGDDTLGTFDSVVLAAPLQQSRISFLIPSHWDDAVLQDMPIADGMVDPEKIDEDHEGHPILPKKVPPCASKPYTQVVTTVVSNAQLNAEYFNLPEEKLPRAVCFTEAGKAKMHNITVISEIAGDGIYKTFSNQQLDAKVLTDLFGPNHKVEFVKVWGGPHGGATPDYRGEGQTVKYLIYDGAAGLEGHTDKGALFYVNSIESAVACMEVSAIGAKSVAKLVARRHKWIIPSTVSKHDGEEL